MEFSISALIDGAIHLAAFLVVCGALYGFLLLVARSRFESNFFRTVFVVVTLVTARLYLLQADWTSTAFDGVILFVLSAVLLVAVLKTDLIVTIITPFVLVALLLGMEQAAFTISKKLNPDGVTFSEFSGRAQSAIERNRDTADHKTSEVDLRDISRRGLDALATLTTKREMDAMKKDFSHGVNLFAERKEWMDSLTPDEKKAYREEMSAFLAEQGLAEDRYSLKAIREANPTNLIVLASLFDDLQDDEKEEAERIRSIPESLSIIASNLRSVELNDADLEALQAYGELFAREEIDEAVAKARNDLEESGGKNELAAMALAAMVQSKSGLPLDQLVAGRDAALFNTETANSLSGRSTQSMDTGKVRDGAVEMELKPADQSKPYVEISCPLGTVRIASDSPDMDDWIVASQALEIRGYASLGSEVALLRQDGTVCVKGDGLPLDYAGLTYHFRVMSVERNRVVLLADYIEIPEPDMSRFY
jgi:hypothetical protein